MLRQQSQNLNCILRVSATFPNHKKKSFVAFIPNVLSPWNLSSKNSGNPTDEKAQKCNSCSKWKPPRKQSLLDQLKQVYMSSQTLKQNVRDMKMSAPGLLHIYYSFKFSAFMGLLSVWTSRSQILVPYLFPFSLCCIVLSIPNVMVNVLSYCRRSFCPTGTVTIQSQRTHRGL